MNSGGSRTRVLLTVVVTMVVCLAIAVPAVGAPGGGTGGFGGGGGGGGYSGGGGGGGGYSGRSGGSSSEFDWDDASPLEKALYAIFVAGFLLFGLAMVGVCLWLGADLAISKYRGSPTRLSRLRRRRARRVELLAEEAAVDDPAFAPEAVKQTAQQLHADIIKAWNDEDAKALASLLGADLLNEWELRLADFGRKGWHNVSEVVVPPEIQYVGLVNREKVTEDRVVVHIEVRLNDVVYDKSGKVITRNEDENQDGLITQSEYWTLARREGKWVLVSIEQELEGAHHLEEVVIPSPSSDGRLRDEAVTENAVAASVPDTEVGKIADVEFEGDARTAALDMANIDGRFEPDVLEAAARRVLDAWMEAVDGDDAALAAVSTPGVAEELLYPGDPSHRSRLVVRGLALRALRITAVDAAADPPSMTVEAEIIGRRYVEDRNTTTVVAGNKDREIAFTERWRLVLDGRDDTPWRIAGVYAEPTRT